VRRLIPLLALASLSLAACSDLLTTAAATVDGSKIDEDTFVRELEFLLADPRFAAQLPTGVEGETARKDLARQFLTFQIHQLIVSSYADQNGVETDSAVVDELYQQQVADLGGPEEYATILREAGATERDVRELLEQQVLREDVAQAVVAEQLGDEQLQEEYESRKLEFSQVHVAHILVGSEEEATELLEEATPNNFAALAQRSSLDEASAANGGDLGVQRAVDLVQPFADATLEIPVGEVGGPVETEFGWHLIYVMDRQTQPFEAVSEDLLGELRGQVFTQWLLDRVQSAEIRVNPRYGFFDEETGSVIERTATSPLPVPSIQLQP
jgi:parvulin-like peptidyl-prolyl isomerase